MAGPAFLLFDLDGTLVDSAPAIATALTIQRGRRGGGAVAVDDVRPLVSLGVEILVSRALGALAADPAADVAEFRRTLAALPTDPACCYAGVAATLGELRAAGHGMAVVTNKPEALSRTLLAELGLAGHFAAIVGGDTLPRRKPDPASAIHALDALGARAGEAVFIGDSPVDAQTARRLAMPFLLFEGGYDAAACAREEVAGRFAAFAALPALLASLARDRARRAAPGPEASGAPR